MAEKRPGAEDTRLSQQSGIEPDTTVSTDRLNVNEVLVLLGMSNATLYKMIRKGQFPKARKSFGRSATWWPRQEVEDWVRVNR